MSSKAPERVVLCFISRIADAVARSEIVFDDWTWTRRDRLKIDGETIEISNPLAPSDVYQLFRQNGMEQVPPELDFQCTFSPPFKVYDFVYEESINFDPRGATLVGVGTREWDFDRCYAGPTWTAVEWLFNCNGTWLLIRQERHTEAPEASDPVFLQLGDEEAAEWCAEHGEIQPEQRALSTILTPDVDTPEPSPALEESHSDGKAPKPDVANGGMSKRKSVSQRRIERDDWLLKWFERKKLTRGELLDRLRRVAAKKDWPMLDDENSVSDALKRAYGRKHGQPWPFDHRGKKKQRNNEM